MEISLFQKATKISTKQHKICSVPDSQLLHLCCETAWIFNPSITKVECQAAQSLCV